MLQSTRSLRVEDGGVRRVFSQARKKEAAEEQTQLLVTNKAGCSCFSFLDTAEIELKVRTEKRRPQDWRLGQEAELRVRDGHTEHVSCHIRNTLQNKKIQ